MLGRYSFPKPGDGPQLRPLRDPRPAGELMRAKDIEPGREYGRTRTGYTPHKVTVTAVTPQRVSYVDESGTRGHARPNEITGLWEAHEAGLHRAEHARDVLFDAVCPGLAQGVWVGYRLDRAAVAEDDEWGVNLTLTAAQALRLADLLRDASGGVHAPSPVA